MTTLELFMKAKEYQRAAYGKISIKEEQSLKGFTCFCCKEECSFFDLEKYFCDFDDLTGKGLICSLCFEEGMGEDL